MSPTKRAKPKPKQPEGLIGLFGHFWIDDPENAGERMIQFIFRIIRKLEGERYVVQYYSYLDGGPAAVGVHPEAELLGRNVRLYADKEVWIEIFKEEDRSYWHLRKIRQQKAVHHEH